MNVLRFLFLTACCLAAGFACSPSSSPTRQNSSAEPTATELASLEFRVTDFAKAQSHSVATGPDGSVYLIYGKDHSLFVSRSTNSRQTFGDAVLATGESEVLILPIEHPAIAVEKSGQVGIAWLQMPPDFEGADVWYAVSDDGAETFKLGQLVAAEADGEVAMVEIAFDGEGNPILTWLNNSELHFSRSSDGGATFSRVARIGQGSCECCQPQAVTQGDDVYIAYRSLEPGNVRGDIRDIVMIRSTDGGQTFQPVTRVSDEHWYLPACPIAGPSLAFHDATFFVAWMDGRLEPAGSFSRGDIWLASSQDGGRTFSPNIHINPDESMHQTLPSIAAGPGGRIHISWEAQVQATREGFLYYSYSDDGGRSFAPAQIIADSTDSARGNPGKPIVAVDSIGHVNLAWSDQLGVRVASWTDTR